MKKDRIIKLWKLFTATAYISTFTFGGGFVIITLMKQKFVDKLHWIDDDEMLDITSIAQASPGAIAVNAAIMVGWRIAGFLGMLVAVLGTILPPMAIITVISLFYSAFAVNRYVAFTLKGMQAGAAAVIFDVVCCLGARVVKARSLLLILMMLGAFAAVFFFNVNVIYIILAAIVIGLVRETVRHRKKHRVLPNERQKGDG